jgi:hypothetical protein
MVRARCILDERYVRGDLLVEIVLWQLPAASAHRPHGLKYRLYCGRAGACVVRYDNETGKGDHRHCGAREEPYAFVSLERLLADFTADVARLTGWRLT